MFKFRTNRINHPLPEGSFVYRGKKFKYLASFNFYKCSQDITIEFKENRCVFITYISNGTWEAAVINYENNPVKRYNIQSFITTFLNSISKHMAGNMSAENDSTDTADQRSSVAQQQQENSESNRNDTRRQQAVAGNLQDAQHPETTSSGTNSSPCLVKTSRGEVGTGKSAGKQGGLQDATEQATADMNAETDPVGEDTTGSISGAEMLGNQHHTASQIVDAVLASLENKEEVYINKRYFNLPYEVKNVGEFLSGFIGLTKKLDDYLFKKLKLIFKKYIDNIGIGRTNPELDKKLLIKNIVSFKNPYNSYKRNRVNKRIIIMVDTSGSMTNFYDSIPYWIKFAQMYKQEILLILHNNTRPYAIIDNGMIMEIDAGYSDGIEFYKQLIKKYTIPLVVAFTDWDGMENYITLLQQTKILALDVYECNHGEPLKDDNRIPQDLKLYKKQITYYYRVKNFEQSLEILKNEL